MKYLIVILFLSGCLDASTIIPCQKACGDAGVKEVSRDHCVCKP